MDYELEVTTRLDTEHIEGLSECLRTVIALRRSRTEHRLALRISDGDGTGVDLDDGPARAFFTDLLNVVELFGGRV